MNPMFPKNLRTLIAGAAAITLLLLTGCAHSISIAPEMSKIPPASSKIAKTAGYVILETNRWRQVTTPGGGGDSVKYFPYKDLEPGFRKALGEVFDSVVKLTGPEDNATITAKNISFIITPSITTTSSSSSALTWPPTSFTVELNCAVIDARGQPIVQIKSQGQGQATFDEFKHEFALAARRAAEQALGNLVNSLAAAPELRR